jgi:hypothetical protein
LSRVLRQARLLAGFDHRLSQQESQGASSMTFHELKEMHGRCASSRTIGVCILLAMLSLVCSWSCDRVALGSQAQKPNAPSTFLDGVPHLNGLGAAQTVMLSYNGKFDVESIEQGYIWSVRRAKMYIAENPSDVGTALKQHFIRMSEVENIVHEQEKTHAAIPTVAERTAYFRAEAERWERDGVMH